MESSFNSAYKNGTFTALNGGEKHEFGQNVLPLILTAGPGFSVRASLIGILGEGPGVGGRLVDVVEVDEFSRAPSSSRSIFFAK